MKKINYIILHYQVIADTIECVESIIKLQDKDIEQKIIIVDNCSPNKSGEVLKEKYADSLNVIVILSETNLGFAKGNNLGCNFAIDNYEPDFLVVLNNDIIINQKDFENKIIDLKISHNFDVLGPDIISLIDNLHQNPVDFAIVTKKAIIKEFLLLVFLLLLSFINLDQKFVFFWNEKKYKNRIAFSEYKNDVFRKNIKVHGAAVIFSKSYFKKFKDVFFDKTFMFLEEDILYHRIRRNSMKVIYSNKINVFHKEDSATNSVFKKATAKRRFIYKNTIKSLYEYFRAYNTL
ncbi:glycosyltransferase family 2 protein [Flavobacterium nitrogenifigens]|uniref:Glycosyltransferase, GT2 family n=1 Tax=Flavobacterium nitrogenifigens TaxID=1617283 RepID=A0A521DJ00_9FLAO|nr:glycosyltransferase [Flavobacterium nitrogenifigens]KAF2330061.1 glycosyltransferase family 2 protein [Flavobacterium nitrogenifigens]SMO71693.1 Glycosyltransferase, GT2 family [Flavobacterium nitrogenifigens]